MRISPEEFVRLWQNSNSLSEFSEKSGIKRANASLTAMRYRKHGVKLKKFVRQEHINWNKLKNLANYIGGKK